MTAQLAFDFYGTTGDLDVQAAEDAAAELAYDSLVETLVVTLAEAKVILTTAHLNHTPEDCRDENLRAMCQGCHLHYDIEHHMQTAQQTRTAQLAGQMDPLFDIAEEVHRG